MLSGVLALALLHGIPEETLGIFQSKCAGCHSPQAKKVFGNFDYILDLKKVVANSEMIVPGKPASSNLWLLVNAGNMPPNDSPTGPLSDQQKQTIQEWVVEGTLPPEPTADSERIVVNSEPPPPAPMWWRALVWLGKFHLLLLHFPIALIFTALVVEGISLVRPLWYSFMISNVCVDGAAMMGLPVVAAGWMHGMSHGSGTPLLLHRVLGTLAGVLLVGTALVCQFDGRRGRRSWWARGLIALTAALSAFAAHIGGQMVHGENFLNF